MRRSALLAAALLIFCAPALRASAQAQAPAPAGEDCVLIAGTIAATVTSLPDAPALVVQGPVTGTLRGSVRAQILSQMPRPDGTVALELTHTFVTDEGFLIETRDTATLTPIPGQANVFQMATQYTVTRGTGRFANATGGFINHGETDLARGLLSLAYEGRICGVPR
jgi:hypothetical protein